MSDSSDNPLQLIHQLVGGLPPRQAAFLRAYLDPNGPAFGNQTKAAEIAGYAGEPGSNQLSVQGNRVLKNPRVRECLEDALVAAGCTVELDAQVLRDAMGATHTKFVLGEDNQLISTPPQPDHAVRLRAVELKHRLLRGSRSVSTSGPIAPPASAGITAQPSGVDASSPEYAEAIQKVAELAAIDRVLLREVVASDEKLEQPEPDNGGQRE